MEDFEGMGAFWLPEHSENVLSGHLSFNHEDGVRLSLVGDFSDHPFDDAQHHPRIVGFIGNKRITLDNCDPGNSSRSAPGVRTQEYRIESLWLGHHFASDDELSFDFAVVTFDDLPIWVGKSIIEVHHKYEESRWASTNAKLELIPSQVEECSNRRLTLGISASSGGDLITEFHMRSKPYLMIEHPNPTPHEDLLTEISRIQDLVTVCTDRPCGIRSLHFGREDTPERAINGRAFKAPKQIEYRASQLNPARKEGVSPLKQHRMLLAFDEVGGLPMISRWLRTAPTFNPVLGSLMSSRYRSKMYVENRFLNMTAAAESLHRLTGSGTKLNPQEFARRSEKAINGMATPDEQEWLKSILRYANEPSLGSRLRNLFKDAKPALNGLIKDHGKWSMAVAGMRNRLTHLDDMGGLQFDSSAIYWLSESVYDLTRVALLKEAGLPLERLRALGESAVYNRYADRLQSAIESTRSALADYDALRSRS
ncbi:ApeA N-terminal domain 1-containing protein [Micromonospora radicis]|uniref:ApeA N-terminal domain 1-containing protein n=1 Tax=Micromonospora radicis TaxID=1894971 RepID=UPI0011C38D3C|nr:HEPN domain-containing protein [Micromonospora radicis]